MQRVFPFQAAEGWSGSVRTHQAFGKDFLLIVLVIPNFCYPVFFSPLLFVPVWEFWAVWPCNINISCASFLLEYGTWAHSVFSLEVPLVETIFFCAFSLLWISKFQRSEKDGLKTQLYKDLWGFGQSHSSEPKWVGKQSSCPGWLFVSASNSQREFQIQVLENSITESHS